MDGVTRSLLHALAMSYTLTGCTKDESPARQQAAGTVQGVADSTPATTSARSSPRSDTRAPADAGFDISRAPVVTPRLGKFPYLGLLDGYQATRSDASKDVPFDRYLFIDSVKVIPVDGRLTTIEAEGTRASAQEVFETYESLVTGLGGVKVFEGDLQPIRHLRRRERNDLRHRYPIRTPDQVATYVVRLPDKEIWVEAYASTWARKKGRYFLTVVESKALDVTAALLPAEEMKRELDTKGHVALYINFDFDRAEIRPDSRPIIDEMVKLLENNSDLRLTVEGHTDNVGTPTHNRQLSDARAKAVVAALTARGIDGTRLNGVGRGQDKPIADNGTDNDRAKNRRVELVKVI